MLLAADAGSDAHARVDSGLADGSLLPNDEKRAMARAVVELYHPGGGAAAEAAFDRVHREHLAPEELPQATLPADVVRDGTIWLPRLLTAAGLAGSNAEAKRLVAQGGVRLDGTVLDDPDAELPLDAVIGGTLQVGRRRFVQVTGVELASG